MHDVKMGAGGGGGEGRALSFYRAQIVVRKKKIAIKQQKDEFLSWHKVPAWNKIQNFF